jgi:arabinofuranosyltransferase
MSIQRQQTRGSEDPEARWPNRLVLAGLAVAVAVYAIRCGAYWHYVNDDAFITFRYSLFLATGRGPYYNPGEHVEGYTNFSLMLAMVPVYWLWGQAALPVAAKVIGIASGLGSLLLTWALTRSLLVAQGLKQASAGLAAVAAAALVAVSPAYAANSTNGLATTLFGFFLILGVSLSLRAERRGRWCGAGLAYAALLLTRPEGSFLFAVVWLAQLGWVSHRRHRSVPTGSEPWWRSAALRRLALDAAIVVGVFLAQLALRRLLYDDEWLPNTYYAKSGGFWKIAAGHYIREGILAPLLGFAGVALALPGAVLAVRRAGAALLILAAAIAGACVPFITGTDWMPGWRLLMPYLPVAAAAVVVGWATASHRAFPRAGWAAPAIALGAAIASACIQLPLQARLAEVVSLRTAGYATGHRALAKWLCEDGRARPGDRIALMDIGIIGYVCEDQLILDISGLTDRFIAKTDGEFLRKNYDPGYVLDTRPRFIVLTLTADGWYYQPPPRGTKFRYWTRMERRLYNAPEFKARYTRAATGPPATADASLNDPAGESAEGWQADLARRVGAVRIFEHAYPAAYYLLAVFDAEAAGESADSDR